MGKKISKTDRIAVITKTLVENPKSIFTLNHFAEKLDCAKSTLSEDMDVIEDVFRRFHLGEIHSVPGAAGGIYYNPKLTDSQIEAICEELCQRIKDKSRIIPGGYLYMNDIFYDPNVLQKIAKSLAAPYLGQKIDYVVTIETKGIPLAIMTAQVLNIPMIVVRKSARLTEGTTIQMNYVAGSSRRINTMAIAKRSIPKGAKVLFVDDFMKAGGTAKGITDLMKELEAEVVGIAVVMATKKPSEKLIQDYYALLEFDGIDEREENIRIYRRVKQEE
ncbi:pur operon repressor [Vallitalea pronyensis]|uniref:Pur operon repressor n=1 Tax=Vallitalea pronyensis TaxID=1348613 RepID=A0A8J8MG40_9FIRM|nr:pur operon repressor [Vallitalea pronyensis]QUI20836.1 pur operon repressor [Vallitalea pronyensis]